MNFILIGLLLGVFTLINILAPISGSATVTPVLTGLVGAKDAIAVATVFFFLTCIPRVYLFREYIRWDIVKLLWPISILGALAGSILFIHISELVVSLIILAFLIYFLSQKLQASFSSKKTTERKTTKHGVASVGFFSGALQGTGLAGSDLRNGYLLSRGLAIPNLHGTTALIGGANFLFASISRVVSGELTFQMAYPILLLLPVIVLATYIGRHLTLKLPKIWQDRFALLVMVIALGMITFKLFEYL
tara:strand:+ start:905 stop:1648 length:744 start_codon:yes stop_codon:yes gene_type:complete